MTGKVLAIAEWLSHLVFLHSSICTSYSDGPAEQRHVHSFRRVVKYNQVGCGLDLYEHIRLQKCEARKRLLFSASGAIVEAQQAKRLLVPLGIETCAERMVIAMGAFVRVGKNAVSLSKKGLKIVKPKKPKKK